METGKEKLEEINNTPESFKSSPSSTFSFEGDSIELHRPFPHNLFDFQRQQIFNKLENLLVRYNNCFGCLQQAFAEVNLLQEENLKLRAEHLDLSILVTAKENEITTSFSSGLNSVSNSRQSGLRDDGENEVQQRAAENQNPGSKTEEIPTVTRVVVPKVISIRSAGFPSLNSNQSVGGASSSKCSSGANRSHRLRLAANPEQGGEVELEVYNQGMLKTELCNKWEETGCCPYGDRCQFAHGIEELRPVIRHPRYKTELCRMISHGTGTCPYGHRCHFRHALDPNEEKEVVL